MLCFCWQNRRVAHKLWKVFFMGITLCDYFSACSRESLLYSLRLGLCRVTMVTRTTLSYDQLRRLLCGKKKRHPQSFLLPIFPTMWLLFRLTNPVSRVKEKTTCDQVLFIFGNAAAVHSHLEKRARLRRLGLERWRWQKFRVVNVADNTNVWNRREIRSIEHKL